MLLKKLIFVFFCASLSTQSLAIGEKEAEKEEEEFNSFEMPSSDKETIPSYQMEIHYQSEIYEYLEQIRIDLLKANLTHQEAIIKLNDIYNSKIKNMLWKLMGLIKYPEDESVVLKLASFLVQFFVWNQLGHQVGVQVQKQIIAQVMNQLRIPHQYGADALANVMNVLKVPNQIEERVRNQISRVWYQIWHRVNDQIGTYVLEQIHAQPNVQFSFVSPLLNMRSYTDSLNVCIHYIFMTTQIHNILRLLSADALVLRNEIASILETNYTPEEIHQMLRTFQGLHQLQIHLMIRNPFLSTQLELLRMHIPSLTNEQMISNFVAGIIAVALSSASSSNP